MGCGIAPSYQVYCSSRVSPNVCIIMSVRHRFLPVLDNTVEYAKLIDMNFFIAFNNTQKMQQAAA